MQNATGKIAIVTGANRGIGLEVVRQLARLGVTVILGSRELSKGKQAAAPMIADGLKVLPRQLDVTSQKSIDALKVQVEADSVAWIFSSTTRLYFMTVGSVE